jgi:hypothetical protein
VVNALSVWGVPYEVQPSTVNYFFVLLLLFFKDAKNLITMHNTADTENVSSLQSVQKMVVPQFMFEVLYTKYGFDKRRGVSCSVCGFSALHILPFWLLMYPLKWDHASSVKKQL